MRPPVSCKGFAAAALLASTPAFAHYPHDVAYWAAISPDPAHPRLATSLERIDLDILGRSEDGLDWEARLVQPIADGHTLSGAFLTADRLVLVVENRGLLTSEDAGDTLVPDPSLTDTDLYRLVPSPAILTDGTVFVAGSTAVWRTTDAGLHWAPVRPAGMTPFTDVDVSPEFATDGRGTLYLTCWNGLARSTDRGLSWSMYTTERPENTHSIAVTTQADGSPAAWIGTYGSGVILTDVATRGARAFPSLPVRYTRGTAATPSWGRDGVAIYDEGYSTWRTVDGGETWQSVVDDPRTKGKVDLDEDPKGVALSPDPAEDPFLLGTFGDRTMSFRYSEDLGDTWSIGVQEPVCEAAGFTVALSPRWPDDSRAWAACGGAVYESLDRGRTWGVLGDTGTRFVFQVAEQDAAEPDGAALLVATNDGLWRIGGGATTRIAFEGALVDSVATSRELDDDTVFALVPTAGWMRSDDGGERWTTPPAPTGNLPRMVALSPSFVEDGTVAVAGYGGAWASTDRGATWRSIYALDVYEGNDDAWQTSGAWREEDVSGASGGKITVADHVGATKTLMFRGIGVAIEAPAAAAEGIAAVSLDGAPAVSVTLPTRSNTVWEASSLADGWHTLRVEVAVGAVTIDDVRVTRLPVEAVEETRSDPGDTCDTCDTCDTADTRDTSDTGGSATGACGSSGCARVSSGSAGGTGGRAALLLFPGGLLVRRRRSNRAPR